MKSTFPNAKAHQQVHEDLDPKHNISYRSSLSQSEEDLARRISQHTDSLFRFIEEARVKKSPDSETRTFLQHHFHQFCQIFVDKPSTSDDNENLMAIYLYSTFFGISLLDSRQNKAREMIEAIDKCVDFIGARPHYPLESAMAAGEEMIRLDFKKVIDRFNRHIGLSNKHCLSVIDNLNRRLIFVSQLMSQGRQQFIAREEFDRMLNDANEQIGNVDSVPKELQETYNIVLSLLGGNIHVLKNIAGTDILSLIKGYLTFVDPFLSNLKSHQELGHKCPELVSGNILELIYMTLSDQYRADDLLLQCRHVLPPYTYAIHGLYSYYLGKLRRETRGSMTPESDYLISMIKYCSDVKLDFFTAKPFIERLATIFASSSHSSQELEEMIEDFHSGVLNICINTLDKRYNASNLQSMNGTHQIMSAFLKSLNMDQIRARLRDQYFQSRLYDRQACLELLFTLGKEASEEERDTTVIPLFESLFPDQIIYKLTSEDFTPAALVGDEEMLADIQDRLEQHVIGGSSYNSSLFAFLNKYIELRAAITIEINKNRNHTPHAAQDLESIGKIYTSLSKEFCHITICYKIVFSTLIAYRKFYLGSSESIDTMIVVNSRMRRQADILERMSPVEERENHRQLANLVRTANMLLLSMRANSTV